MLITGFLFGEYILIGCVYTPNICEEEFDSLLLAKVATVSLPFTILAGDFNCTVDPEMDQSSQSRASPPKMREVSREVYMELQLLDAWRVCNLTITHFLPSTPMLLSNGLQYSLVSRVCWTGWRTVK